MLEFLFKRIDAIYAEPYIGIKKEGRWWVIEVLCCGALVQEGRSVNLETAICRVIRKLPTENDDESL